VALERIGIHDPSLLLAMFRAAARVSERDPAGRDGDLGAWQSAVAIVESSRIRGGLDYAEAAAACVELAALAGREPASEVTAWLLEKFAPRVLARPGAPDSAERAILQTMSGALTRSGPRRAEPFHWEDLTYTFVPHQVAWRRMEEARAAQESASLDEAMSAWRSGAQARSKAVAIVTRILPALAYALHQAASATPALGADIPFRHQFASANTGAEIGRRPWLIASGDVGTRGWHLQGSVLSLDLALFEWYVTRHGEPPSMAPTMDEPDVNTLALMIALMRSHSAPELKLEEALAAVDRGREVAAALGTAGELDAALRGVGVDPWRRRSLRLQHHGAALPTNGHPQEGAAPPALALSELWQLGGAAGSFAVRWPLDGCACFGPVPRAPWLLDGRRSAGLIGATAADPVLRVALFLRDRRLPLGLFGGILSSAIVDVVHGAQGVRPDDRVAVATAASHIADARLEEHLLALVASGALARP
jgi:hypothetical protein